ncbi:MAG: rhodanese-like domain-containing protein [Rhodoferax sp.]|nr:rhodanese-like domain-containing protein [Rhodoferax sp.]MCF8208306.1 rhodanese-like domain-containing protein [Rhodoferax sp.]
MKTSTNFARVKTTLLLSALLGGVIGQAAADVVHIDAAELARLVARGVPVIDIRTAPEWKETGVLAGSKLMTFFDEKGQADAAGWVNRLKPTAGPDQPVILICRTGNRTSAVAQFLSTQVGYKTVYNVTGGIHAWMKAGRPVIASGAAH